MPNNDLSQEVTELRVAIAKLSTTLEMSLEANSAKLNSLSSGITDLKRDMETALLPFKVGKALTVTITALSIILGGLYGVFQAVTSLGTGRGPTG